MAPPTERKREKRTFWYTLARVLLFFFVPLFYPVRYHGTKQADALDAPYLLVSNHGSMMDPLVIVLPIKRFEVRFLGKSELVKNPILAYLVRKLHMISVSRHMTDMAAMRASNEVLKAGHVLGIFPEGTRKPPERLMEGVESGVSLIALRNKVPVLPVYIHGRMRPFRRTHIYYLPPLEYGHLLEKGLGKDTVDAFTDLLTGTFLDARDRVQAGQDRV